MMNLSNWTVSFRPLRALRNLAMLVAFVCGVGFASPVSHDVPSREYVQVSEAVLANRYAVAKVEKLLCDRMAYLDAGRRAELAQTIVDESVAARLDPLFVLAIIQVESRFDHEAVSPTGARGLMQVIPATWNEVIQKTGLPRREKFNPSHNVQVGIRYIALLFKNGIRRPESLLLAYNQGLGTVLAVNGGAEVPPEGAAYTPAVLSAYRKLLQEQGLSGKDYRKFWRSPGLTIVRANASLVPPTVHVQPQARAFVARL